MPRKKVRKIIKAIKILLMLFVGYIVISLLILKIGMQIYYNDFYNTAQREFKIPGLIYGFVPQGFEYRAEDDVFLISGYENEKDNSIIYVATPDGSYRKVEILNTDGNALISHAGGVCSLGDYIYISGCDGKCYVLTAESVMSKESEYAAIIGNFETYNKADFCYVYNEKIYIGEYYHPIKYKTEDEHFIVTPSGDENKAIVTVFEIDRDKKLGLKANPVEAYSIRSTVQGMCITDDNKLVLSISSVLKGSQLYCYDYNSITKGEAGTILINGTPVPLYYIDGNAFKQKIEVLPKSEGVDFCDGRVYMLFESASNRFTYGKLIRANYVYSYDVR